MRSLPLLLLLLASCDRQGTFYLEVIAAPGSALIADIHELELRLTTDPPVIATSERQADGSFDLTLAVDTGDALATVVVLGYDEGHQLIARGASALLPLSGATGRVKIFLAPPWSATEAPARIPQGLQDFCATSLAGVALIFGGSTDATQASLAYNANLHSFAAQTPLPEPRRNCVAVATDGDAVVFGGVDDNGGLRDDVWRFSPSSGGGAYVAGPPTTANLGRSGASGARLGTDQILVTGSPALELNLSDLSIEATMDATGLAASANTAAGFAGLVVGEASAVSFDANGLASVTSPVPGLLRTGHSVVAMDHRIVVIGGRDGNGLTADAVIFDTDDGSYTTVSDVLTVPRSGAAAAATETFIAVAGGVDGGDQPIDQVSFLRPDDLSTIATSSLVVPRSFATAITLANQQVLLVGGVDAGGDVVDLVELLSPGEP